MFSMAHVLIMNYALDESVKEKLVKYEDRLILISSSLTEEKDVSGIASKTEYGVFNADLTHVYVNVFSNGANLAEVKSTSAYYDGNDNTDDGGKDDKQINKNEESCPLTRISTNVTTVERHLLGKVTYCFINKHTVLRGPTNVTNKQRHFYTRELHKT